LFWPQREAIAPDADGNLTSDSLWTNRWDAQNRRTVIESRAGLPPAAQRREQWTLLPDGRWIERIVSTNNGTAYFPAFTNRYVWDGQVLLALLDGENHPVVTLMRGLDLSGTMQGAGGVGGPLAVSLRDRGTHFVCYDGNGNVVALVNAADGSEGGRYEYGPFGEPLRVTGPVAKANPLRFSTHYADDETGQVKYLFRDYDPDRGRWPNRDPIAERGGLNLYGFVRNNPANLIDSDGRAPMGWPVVPPPGYPPSIPPKPPSDTSIRKCNRKIENPSNDFVIGCANLRGHDYFDWPDGDGGRDGIGYPGQDTLPTSEAGSQPRFCRPC
jgi:RHS repeat-associated protein